MLGSQDFGVVAEGKSVVIQDNYLYIWNSEREEYENTHIRLVSDDNISARFQYDKAVPSLSLKEVVTSVNITEISSDGKIILTPIMLDGADIEITEAGEYTWEKPYRIKKITGTITGSGVYSYLYDIEDVVEELKGTYRDLSANADILSDFIQALEEYCDDNADRIEEIEDDLKNLINSVTYAELSSMIASSLLIPGAYYLITDYATIYKQPETALTMTGSNEPLLVQAQSSTKLKPIAFSPSRPKDVIYYDINNDTALYDWAVSTGKGIIYRRIDQNNNDLPYDFKQIKFRRWAIDYDSIAVWDSTSTYTSGTLIRNAGTVNNIVYFANKNVPANQNPTETNSTYWEVAFTDVAGSAKKYWSEKTTKKIYGAKVDPADNVSKNTEINIPIKTTDYKDLYTFHNYNNDSDSSEVASSCFENTFKDWISSGKKCLGNNVFANYGNVAVYYNTIGNTFYYNTIRNNIN
jgi:hypothetical protein